MTVWLPASSSMLSPMVQVDPEERVHLEIAGALQPGGEALDAPEVAVGRTALRNLRACPCRGSERLGRPVWVRFAVGRRVLSGIG